MFFSRQMAFQMILIVLPFYLTPSYIVYWYETDFMKCHQLMIQEKTLAQPFSFSFRFYRWRVGFGKFFDRVIPNKIEGKFEDKRTNNDIQNTTQKPKRSSNTNPTKYRCELRCSGRVSSSSSKEASVVLLLLQKSSEVMIMERTALLLQRTEHMRGHLWYKYSVTVNQVMVATVKFSRWLLRLHR